MTPKAYALLTLLAVVLATAWASAAPAPASAAPPKRPCTFQALPGGRTLVTCPRTVLGPAKGRVP
jgi:hypothetical protein